MTKEYLVSEALAQRATAHWYRRNAQPMTAAFYVSCARDTLARARITRSRFDAVPAARSNVLQMIEQLRG